MSHMSGNGFGADPRMSLSGDRMSVISSSSSTMYQPTYAGPYGAAGPYQQHHRPPSARGRSEIIMVSDDRVMALQMAAPQLPMSDSASYVSR